MVGKKFDANLRNANLSGDNLCCFNSKNNRLSSTNLFYANIGGVNLRSTLICKTIMPNGEISNRDCL